MKRRQFSATAVAVTVAAGLAACGSTSSSGGAASSSQAGPRTLEVWLMKGSAPDAVVKDLNTEFQSTHPGVTVKVDIQVWDGIANKVTTALATSSPPDVLEMGNTQVSTFAAAGGLMKLTDKKGDLGGGSWLKSLEEAGTYNNDLYGVPYYAGDRVVIYNKAQFAAAGIAGPPTTRDELVADAQKLMAANASKPGYSGLYLPGKYWYAQFSWVFDNGGAIATQSGGKWAGKLEDPATTDALQWIKDNRAKMGTAAGDADEAKDADVFGAGNAGMIIDPGWQFGVVTTAHPELKASMGVFAIPGKSGPAPVFLGGSNLGIAAKSPNQDLAYDYVKLLSSNKYQTELATQGGVIPNTTDLLTIHSSDPILSVADTAAKNSWFTPSSPNWASVEGANIITDMLGNIMTGKQTVADATKAADAAIADKLNQ